MALNRYTCNSCQTLTPFWDYEVKVCKCGSTDLSRAMKAPLSNKITSKTDTYHNVNAEDGIQEDTKKRSAQHILDTIDEMIEEFGEEIAKEQGWLVWDATQKKWRKRNEFDVGLLNTANAGSAATFRRQKEKK